MPGIHTGTHGLRTIAARCRHASTTIRYFLNCDLSRAKLPPFPIMAGYIRDSLGSKTRSYEPRDACLGSFEGSGRDCRFGTKVGSRPARSQTQNARHCARHIDYERLWTGFGMFRRRSETFYLRATTGSARGCRPQLPAKSREGTQPSQLRSSLHSSLLCGGC
jgi:hypothetical protein